MGSGIVEGLTYLRSTSQRRAIDDEPGGVVDPSNDLDAKEQNSFGPQDKPA